MFRYKGQSADPQKIGRELGVGAILTGQVSQQEANLRIQVDLIRVADGSQVWGHGYNLKFADIQAVRDQMVRDISERLQVRLNQGQQQKLVKRDTQNSEAYDFYLRGRFHLSKRTDEGIKAAIDFFQQAIAKDPNFGLAYAGLADCYIVGSNALPWTETEVRLKAKDAAQRALEKDDTLAEAHTSLAVVNMLYEWSWASADKEFKRAIELNPNYVTAHHWYAEYLAMRGRFDEALTEILFAQKLDPMSVIISRDVGMQHYYAGRYDAAIQQAQNALGLDPDFVQAHRLLGFTYLKQKRFKEAINELQTARTRSNGARDVAFLAHAYALDGSRAEAIKLLDSIVHDSHMSPYYLAIVYSGLGDRDQAFDCLERAYREQASALLYLKIDPKLDTLRDDQRFSDLTKRIGLND
jgi:tetratricopeptide (TPR) repeat protein